MPSVLARAISALERISMTKPTSFRSGHTRESKGFELKPPGSFRVCVERSLEGATDRDLKKIVGTVAEVMACYPVVGLILTGSVARGEGTVVADEELTFRWSSDLEFQLVLEGGRSARVNEVDAILAALERTINEEPLNHRRGVKCSFTSIQTGQIARLRPAIFSREMLEHGKLVWGEPDRIPVPIWWHEGPNEIPYRDAFRLLSNRIIQQVDARFQWRYSGQGAAQASYTLAKFWIELATSLSVFIGCYRTSYRERQRTVEHYLINNPGVLGDAGELLVDRLRQAMAVKAGCATPDPCSESKFRDSARVAALIWTLEVRRILDPSHRFVDCSEPGMIVAALKRVESYSQRVRDWVRLLRRRRGNSFFQTDLKSAIRAGSLANAIYASGSILHFFWDEFASDTVRGVRLRRTVRKLLSIPQQEGKGVDQRMILSRATVAAWERHLHFAPR
jgi:hypothetical protein